MDCHVLHQSIFPTQELMFPESPELQADSLSAEPSGKPIGFSYQGTVLNHFNILPLNNSLLLTGISSYFFPSIDAPHLLIAVENLLLQDDVHLMEDLMVRTIYYLALNLHKQAQCLGMKINNAPQFNVLLYIFKHVQASQLFHPQVSLPLHLYSVLFFTI